MITLLHTEIDAVPARRPQRQALPEGFVGMGTGVLRITNTTGRENAYTVRIVCDDPYWQDAWFKVSAMPPAPGQTAPPASKPDQLGPKEQWIKVFVSHTATRDVLLSFFVPDKPESRAGVYPITVVIETQILDTDPSAKNKERITEIKGAVIIRPYYSWAIEFQPPERRVGLTRRRTSLELVVHNRGNDWLYCDIKLGKAQQVIADVDVFRLAVPPPEPGKESFRSIPVRALNKRRNIRGVIQPDEIPFTFQRSDAPSVPPLPEEAQTSVCGAGLGNPVLSNETSDLVSPESPPKVIYCPPIPATLTEFVQSLARNAMALSMLFIGLVVMWHMALLGWYWLFKKLADFEPLKTSVAAGQPIPVKGSMIIGDKVFFVDPNSGITVKTKIVKPDISKTGNIGSRGLVDTKDVPEGEYYLQAQRSTAFGYLSSIMPRYGEKEKKWLVQVGKVRAAIGEIILPDSIKPGQSFSLTGPDFGKEITVYFGNVLAKTTSKGNDTIVVMAPKDIESDTVTVRVMRKGEDKPLAKQSVMVVWDQGETGGMTGGTTAGETTGGETAGTTAGATTGISGTGGTGTGTAGTGTSGTGGTDIPARPRIPGYNELVAALASEDYGSAAAALDAELDLQNPAAFAVNAYALAAQGRRGDAQAMIGQARTVLRGTRNAQLKKDAEAIIITAQARILDTPRAQPRDVAQKYGEALSYSLTNKASAFPGLALADYLIRVDKPQAALQILGQVRQLKMNAAEEAAAKRLENAARG